MIIRTDKYYCQITKTLSLILSKLWGCIGNYTKSTPLAHRLTSCLMCEEKLALIKI